jgi:hypothetical protein
MKRKVNWKQTEGMRDVSYMAIADFLKDSMLRRAEKATPNNWMKVSTWAANWASKNIVENIRQNPKIAIINKKVKPNYFSDLIIRKLSKHSTNVKYAHKHQAEQYSIKQEKGAP